MDNRCCRICLISASAPPPPFRSNLNSPLTSVEAHHAPSTRLNTIAEPTKPYSKYSYSNQPVIINPSPQTVDLKRSRSMDSDLRLSASTRMNEASDQI
ncbi:hypothetical protein YC2023_073671 [Brassica napus]